MLRRGATDPAGDDVMAVLYKRLRGGRVIVELLYSLRRVRGPDDEVCVFFEPVDESQLEARDPEAANKLHQRRKSVLEHTVNVVVVGGREIGCLVMVRLSPPTRPPTDLLANSSLSLCLSVSLVSCLVSLPPSSSSPPPAP